MDIARRHWLRASVGLWSLAGVARTSAEPRRRGQVLLIAPERFASIRRVEAALASGGGGSPALPPIKAQWHRADTAIEAAEVVSRIAASGVFIEVVFTTSQSWARAIQRAAPKVNLVFTGVDDPMRHCLVDSLSAPGRNATGYMHHLAISEAKMLQWLVLAFPHLTHVVVPVSEFNRERSWCDPDDTEPAPQAEKCGPRQMQRNAYVDARFSSPALHRYARSIGMALSFSIMCRPSEFGRLRLPTRRTGLLVPWHQAFADAAGEVVRQVGALGAPAIYPSLDFVERGGLMSLEPTDDSKDNDPVLLALFAVLNGSAPGTIPVHTPRGFVAAINATTASSLKPPPALQALRRADIVLP
jgi:ABC-type uncharacterized transport system substrate-binding protein